MAALRHLFRMWPRLALLLIACALIVRGVMPVGWMPVMGTTGVVIVPCDGSGPAMAMPMRHDARHQDGGRGDTLGEHPCAFAAVGQVASLTAPPAGEILPVTDLAEATGRLLVLVGQGLAAPPPPATGPPASA